MQNLTERKAAIQRRLNFLTVTRIRALYRLFFPMGNTNRSRDELSAMVLKFLSFENQEKFDVWFDAFTKAEQMILRKLAFYKVYPVTSLEAETGMALMSTTKGRYSIEVQISPDFKLAPLEFHLTNEVFVIVMPEVLQIALTPFLEPPKYHSANGDAPEKISGEPLVFDNSNNFATLFQLLYEAVSAQNCPLRDFPSQNPLKLTRKDTATLYRESGFPAFPACDFPVPDSLGLAAAFILCQNHGKLPPNSVPLREMVRRFFFWNPDGASSYQYYAGSYFEGLLIGAYMKKRGPSSFETAQERPLTRQVFLNFLKSVENRNAAVTMDEMYSFVLARGLFRFSDIDLSRCYRFKASAFTVDGVTYRSDYAEIVPEQSLIFELITKPLFRAYCFLFCALGCLEIAVAEPSYTSYKAELHNKPISVSPYDGIQTFRLTAFGKWCLGFTEQMPEEEAEHFEISADPALLYITLRGQSRERQVFLDKIGEKIGQERWTVNAASFAGGCTKKAEITERVNKFHALVDEHPAEHWETFFAQIERNAGAVTEKTGNYLVYHIDMDKETRASLMSDAEFRRAARFAEDNYVLVPKSSRQKFLSILASRGIGALATPHSKDSPPD
ncbi:MAG: hypothetical protein LBL31_06780 [Spirochaetaceae bacterium]|jgi:hypothetical protein|nr:hypothetical protein [Spirochaetaceae bacterium]